MKQTPVQVVEILSTAVQKVMLSIAALIFAIAIFNLTKMDFRGFNSGNYTGTTNDDIRKYEEQKKTLEDYINFIDTVGDNTAIDSIHNRLKSRLNQD
jgi:hypothetical protein